MKIRQSQLDALTLSRKQDLIRRQALHFSKLWPTRVRSLGEGYRAWITSAIASAEKLGLANEQDVSRFVNLCFVWGLGFEENPEYPWSGLIISNKELSPRAKLHQLCHETKTRLAARKSR